jgi:hypothetical protein
MVPDRFAARGHGFERMRVSWIGNPVVWAALLIAAAYVALGVFADHWLITLTPFPVTDDFRIYYDACLRALHGDNTPHRPYGALQFGTARGAAEATARLRSRCASAPSRRSSTR